MGEETGDSDTGDGVAYESGEAFEGNLEGPASLPVPGIGIPKFDAYLIDSSMAFANSSSSLETFPDCSFDSLSERASTRLSSSCSLLPGTRLRSFSNFGGELVRTRGGDDTRGGGGKCEGGGTASNGEA